LGIARGRVNVYLLDTDIPENSAGRRIPQNFTRRSRDAQMRQEIILGVGVWKALSALDQPDVFH